MPRLSVLALALLGAAAEAQPDSTGYGSGVPAFETALRYAIPFGMSIVSEGETLIPFGLAIAPAEVPNVVQVHDPGLSGQESLVLLVETLRGISRTGLDDGGAEPRPVAALALALDVLTEVPGRAGRTDALAVILEAPDVPGAVAYVLPYVRDGDGGIEYLDPFFREEAPVLLAR